MPDAGTPTSPAKDAAPRKMSAGGSNTLFAGLMNQKRTTENTAAAARRQSFNDQKQAPTVLGQMWNNFTKGPADK